MDNVYVTYFHLSELKQVSNQSSREIFKTVVILLNEDKKVLAGGIAIQNLRDHYSKKLGNRIALGRALKALKEKRNNGSINREDFSLDDRFKAFSSYKGVFNPSIDDLGYFKGRIDKINTKMNSLSKLEIQE